jgi:hypothetical protein
MANFYRVCNGVCNDVYKYDFSFVENCNSYNVFLYELKLDFSSELESFVKDVSIFGVVSVTEKHCCTSLVKEVKLQAQIPQENKQGVTPQLRFGGH